MICCDYKITTIRRAMSSPNTDWFAGRLAARKLSQRGLAKMMNLDPAAISLMLRGKRKITMPEAAQLAALLDITTSEMFERLGLQNVTPNRIKIVGYLSSALEVIFYGEGSHDFIDPPGEVSKDTVAIQGRTAGSPLDMFDGYIYFIDDKKGNPSEYINMLSMVSIKNNGLKLMVVRKGYKRGMYNLASITGAILDNVELAWASPVTWIKTGI